MLQDLNYDRILARGIRYLPPKGAIRDGKDVVFLRTMEFQEGRTLLFNIYTLTRQESPAQESQAQKSADEMYGPTAYQGGTTWDCTLQTTRLRARTSGELAKLLTQTGFPRLSMYGS